MKILGLVLPVLLLLGTPAIAVEYKGQNIDGKKLPARACFIDRRIPVRSRRGMSNHRKVHRIIAR
ncbi:MAG: hypothetical protein V7K32_16810 [Nostoc sp.]|uniref:hypothetical protein n=1 Tax=Nostoc sp. TaxID=1180 RepID=UPI002FF6B21D